MNVLVINAGSSSLKYQLFDMSTESVIAKGNCDRIGIGGHLKHTPLLNDKPVFNEDIPLPTHAEAINVVMEKLTSADYGVIDSLDEIGAIGHRVVHGGIKFSQSVLIDDDVMTAIEECIPLGPLHIPANLMGISACQKAIPGVPHIAVFDTAFHQTMPEYAYIYAIPYRYYEKHNVRRYGFHGTSHRFVSAQAIELLGGKVEGSKIISCHLGNGSSIAAIKDGVCIDTTMGLTPLEGLPMGTRCGSIDPAIIEFIANLEGSSVADIMAMLNKESGVLAVSGVSSDFRDIEDAAAEGNSRAQLALELFYYQIVKYIGAYMAAMGGADAIVFTGGVGENAPDGREWIIDRLNGLGICINKDINDFKGKLRDITGEGSTVKVWVIPTNEELVIARDTKAIVEK